MNAKVRHIGIFLVALSMGWPALSSAGPADQGAWGQRQTDEPSAGHVRCEKGYVSNHLNPKSIRVWIASEDCPKSESPCPYADQATYRAGPPAAKGIPFTQVRRGVHC